MFESLSVDKRLATGLIGAPVGWRDRHHAVRTNRFEQAKLVALSSHKFTVARTAAGLISAILFAFAAIGHAASEHASSVNGTGGSSATRVLAQWSLGFTKESGINIAYAAANSGVGIAETIARHVDFGCTEIPMSAEDLTKTGLMQFPLLIGGVVVVVNIPGVAPGMLRLNSNLVSKIYLGEIKFWNADEILAANPGLSLPRLPIKLVVRETPASTTLALTSFLTTTDRAWASRMGANQLPKWPAPTLQVATVRAVGEMVQSTPGAVGYINFDEAYRNKLAYAQLRNRAGQYLKPSQDSILATSKVAGLGRTGERIPVLINVEGEQSWPIVEVTYVLVDRKPKNVERARSTLKFFFWAFLQGDKMAADTGFVPLPSSIQAHNVAGFRGVLAPDNTPLDFLN